MGYLVFLLPLWFGWHEVQRYQVAILIGEQVREALLAFMVALVVMVITAVGWLWFYPPPDNLRAGLFVTIAQYAFAAMFIAGLLRIGEKHLRYRHYMRKEFNKGR